MTSVIKKLERPNLIWEATAVSKWQNLVQEASTFSNIHLHENVESYLISNLIRYSNKPWSIHKVLAHDYMKAEKHSGKSELDRWRSIADRGVLIVGLFPGMVERRLVSEEYYINIAQSGYFQIEKPETKQDNTKRQGLVENVVNMATTLRAMRALGDQTMMLGFWEFYYKWFKVPTNRLPG